jgi:DNA primase
VAALRRELAGAAAAPRPARRDGQRRDEPDYDDAGPDLEEAAPPPDWQEAAPRGEGRRPFRPGQAGRGGWTGRKGQDGPPPSASGTSTERVRAVLPGAAADALGLLAACPELAPIAEEERLPGLLPAGPLADLARDLIREPLGLEVALARLAPAVDEPTLRRFQVLAGPGRPEKGAELHFRRACLKASIELVVAEQGRLSAQIAKQGAPVPEDLLTAAQVASRRRSDLETRLRALNANPG